MTSLSEVYEEGVGTVVDRQRRWLGMALFAFGTAMVVAGIVLATTNLAGWLGLDYLEARQYAGILAGLGLPGVFIGIFAVLPANGVTRALAAIGASLALFGVVLFSYAYPEHWLSSNPQFALATILVYLLGTLITFWCFFVGVATFKTRNDPGGSARLIITEEGNVRVVSTSPSVPGFSGIGLFGQDPDGTARTQTQTEVTTDGTDIEDAEVMAQPSSDGGTAVADDPALDQETIEAMKQRGRPDEYCGNCTHFEYVRVEDELTPYCGYHDDIMDDMDACDSWESNN